MRFIFLLYGLLIILLISACSNEKPANVVAVKNATKLSYALNPLNVFRTDSITKALGTASENQKTESRKLFMTGLDLLANKNNAAASIEYFREAIYYYPDEKNYKYLFEAYLKNNSFALADSINNALYGLIEDSESLFNAALVSAAKHDTILCLDELRGAIEAGFIYKDRIVNEKLFSFLENNLSFQAIQVTYFGNDAKLAKILFKAFTNSFPDLDLPYEMKQDSAKNFSFDKYINYDFAAFVPGLKEGRFSRDVSSEYMSLGKFKTDNGIAVLYKSFEMIADTLNPVATNIIVYDTLGHIISSDKIGCFCSPLQTMGFVVNKDLTIDIKTYKISWEFDPLEKGYARNKVVSAEPVESRSFLISRDNTLVNIQNKEIAASGH